VGLKQYVEALRDRDLYLELWPPAKRGDPNSQSEQVFASVADVEEEMGKFTAAIEQLDEHSRHVERDPSAYLVAQLRVAKLYEKAKNPKMARKIYEQILQLYHHTRRKLTPEAMEAVGRASYLLNQDTYDAFDRIKLRLPEAELAKSAKAKGHALLEVQRVYTETVKLGSGAPAICALWRIGLAYQSFAQSLAEAPVPPQFQADARLLQAYKEELAKQAAPVEVKAKELYQSALAKSRELGIYNDCAVRSLEGLARADPKDFAESVVAPVPVEISAAALVLAPAHPLKEVWQSDSALPPKKASASAGSPPAPSAPPAAAPAPTPPAAPSTAQPSATPADSEELSPPPEPAKEHTAPAPVEPGETPAAPATPATPQPQEPEPSF
jgi:tetratricopeptide (TPR) repeat protein